MKKTKIIILFLLIFSLVLISACDSGTDSPSAPGENINNNNPAILGSAGDPENPGETTTEKPPLDLPEADYGGYNFRIMNVEQSNMPWIDVTIFAEEENGIEVNDAVYLRNRTVEALLNINISEIVRGDQSAIASTANRSITAGSDDFDLFMLNANEAVRLAQRELMLDYNGLPHINLDRPYWDNDMRRDLSVGGRNYFMTGDFSMKHYGLNIAMFFNKKLLSDLGLESPYAVIHDGKWTWDKFYEMASVGSVDLNGDGRMDRNDQFGYMSITHIWSPSFLAAAGMQTVLKDENDMHVFGMDNERFITTYLRMTQMMHSGDMLFDADTAGDHRLQDVMFPNNQALFWSEVVHWATILRDMDADFGIIIHPKYDENQEGYWNYAGQPPVMGLPATTSDIDRLGMVLEALCYHSTDTVIKAYYDVLLKTKIARDDESEAMLDIMFTRRFYNLADVFYSQEIHSPMNGTALSKQANADIAGWIERQRGRIDTAIERVNEGFTQ